MNKIIIDKEKIVLNKIAKNIDVKYTPKSNLFGISHLEINIIKDSKLEMEYILDETKLDIVFNISPNVNFQLYEKKNGTKAKIQYTYNLLENSIVNINKYSRTSDIKEMIIINLNERKAELNYNFKSISIDKEVYDIVVCHNAKETISNIKNNTVCLETGKASFQISSYVDNGIKDCIVNQNNQIINLSNNKCEIRPNLYINEYDVVANHSALIGGFSNEEMFYLQSRGINETDAKKLLIRGFLLSDLKNEKLIKEIEKDIKEYWR